MSDVTGIVGVAANDSARYTAFYAALTSLRLPEGWHIRFAMGSDRIRQRNRVVRDALKSEAEWVLFLDDDSVFGPLLLERLLSHDREIVGGLYMQRVFPFSPVAYTEKHDDKYMPLLLDKTLPELVEVLACGTGGMLIHASVFLAMPEPWFDYGVHTEDMLFCESARELGHKVLVDLHDDARIGHLASTTVWPTKVDGEWAVGFTVSDRLNLYCPVGTDEVKPLAEQ